jgi:hypothetical protein
LLVVDVAARDELVDDLAPTVGRLAVGGQAGDKDRLDLVARAEREPRPRTRLDQQVEGVKNRWQVLLAQRVGCVNSSVTLRRSIRG